MQCSKVTRQENQAICLELLWFFVCFFYGVFLGGVVFGIGGFFLAFHFFFLLRMPNFTGRMNNYILRQIDMHAFCKNV